MISPSSSVFAVFDYHQRTKHYLHRYAAGPGGLDWSDQPDPFRRFLGCEKISLPMPGAQLPVKFSGLDAPQASEQQPKTLATLGLLLELSFGLSAWKQYGGERWALRCNPSSGNLHPTEAYVLVLGFEALQSGVYHYCSYEHTLEKRSAFSKLPGASGIFIALSSIHWREAWKYGERAYRYCQHDAGHALAALCYAAAVLGWDVALLGECGDRELAMLLGLDRAEDFHAEETESPDLLCRIDIPGVPAAADLEVLLQHTQSAVFFGRAQRLSPMHNRHWPIIEEVAEATYKPATQEPQRQIACQALPATNYTKTATEIIRQRRSAQQFDGKTVCKWQAFERMLHAVLPDSCIPFDVWRWPPRVHLVLFVHRVEHLQPGIYILPRNPEAVMVLRKTMRSAFEWNLQSGQGGTLPLYRLRATDCRQLARTVSCHQSIASDSSFSLAMLAEFEGPVSAEPWQYRRLFWESGMIGQALYLEAEAAGLRGTGIGCFFDDSVHETLGLHDAQFQSLYHFTVGMPLEDKRLQTLPAYGHLASHARDPVD